MKKRAFKIFIDKIEMFFILLFILALFLLDVNLNILSGYGINAESPIISGITVRTTSLFWFGFLVMSFCFFLISIRSLYRKIKLKKLDLFFTILGIIGWAIILSGGLLIFCNGGNIIIPFFSFAIPRINYYHFGIFLEIFTIFYFALTK